MEKLTTAAVGRSKTVVQQFNLKNATPFGGANLIWRFFEHVGLPAALTSALAPFHKAAHAKYSLVQEVLVLLLGRMLGLGRIHDFRVLEEDPLLKRLLRLPKLPDMTILYKEMVRLGAAQSQQALQPVHEAVLERTLGPEVILDFDSTVETVYGGQQGAAIGYNPTRPGRASFHPQLCFDGPTRSLVEAELRPGNTVSSSGLVETATRIFQRAVLAKRRIVLVRGDRGYGNEAFMALLQARNLPFILKLTPTKRMRAWADSLPYRPIGESVLGDILEVGSGLYQAGEWSRPRRVVVVRERGGEPEQGTLIELPVILDEQFIVTTQDWDEEDIFHSYNQRCTLETSVRTLKEDWSFDAFSKDGFAANAADLFLKGLAYNLTLAMQKAVNPKDVVPVRTAETLRRWWFLLPAVVVSHSGVLHLRLPVEAERGHYGSAWRTLQELIAST